MFTMKNLVTVFTCIDFLHFLIVVVTAVVVVVVVEVVVEVVVVVLVVVVVIARNLEQIENTTHSLSDRSLSITYDSVQHYSVFESYCSFSQLMGHGSTEDPMFSVRATVQAGVERAMDQRQ